MSEAPKDLMDWFREEVGYDFKDCQPRLRGYLVACWRAAQAPLIEDLSHATGHSYCYCDPCMSLASKYREPRRGRAVSKAMNDLIFEPIEKLERSMLTGALAVFMAAIVAMLVYSVLRLDAQHKKADERRVLDKIKHMERYHPED